MKKCANTFRANLRLILSSRKLYTRRALLRQVDRDDRRAGAQEQRQPERRREEDARRHIQRRRRGDAAGLLHLRRGAATGLGRPHPTRLRHNHARAQARVRRQVHER